MQNFDGFPAIRDPAEPIEPAPWEDPDAPKAVTPKAKSCDCATDEEIVALLAAHHEKLRAVFDAQLAEATEQFRAQAAQLIASTTSRAPHERLH